jgi:hypothetical protein
MYTMILLFLTTNGSREEFIKRNKNILDMSNYPELCKKIGVDANENKMKPGWLKLEPASDKSPVMSYYIVRISRNQHTIYEVIFGETLPIGYKGKEILVQS